MDWLSWVSQLGYTQLCVVVGTVSLRGKKDCAGELQFWYRERFKDSRILYASRIGGYEKMVPVCELLMSLRNALSLPILSKQNQQIKTLSTKKSKFHFVQY